MGQLPPLTAGGNGGFFEVNRWIEAQKHEPQRMLVLPLSPSYRMQAGQEENAAGVPSAAAQSQEQQLQHEETHLQSITGQPGLAMHRVGIGPQSYLLVMPTTLQADLALDEAATRIQTTLDTRNEHQL
jgi:hypothetical protein